MVVVKFIISIKNCYDLRYPVHIIKSLVPKWSGKYTFKNKLSHKLSLQLTFFLNRPQNISLSEHFEVMEFYSFWEIQCVSCLTRSDTIYPARVVWYWNTLCIVLSIFVYLTGRKVQLIEERTTLLLPLIEYSRTCSYSDFIFLIVKLLLYVQ